MSPCWLDFAGQKRGSGRVDGELDTSSVRCKAWTAFPAGGAPKQTEQRGFASAERADQDDQFTRLDGQVEPAQDNGFDDATLDTESAEDCLEFRCEVVEIERPPIHLAHVMEPDRGSE